MAALRGAHTDGGIALQQLDVVVAISDTVHQILDLDILVEVDEVAPAFMGEDWPGMGLAHAAAIAGDGRGFAAAGEASVPRCRPTGASTFGHHRFKAICAVDRAGGKDM